MSKVILHLCADTGSDSLPYQNDPEYEVVLVGSNVGVENFSFEAWRHFHGLDKKVYGIIANPVCLEFSTARSGGKARNPDEGMFLVDQCIRIIEEAQKDGGLKFYVIENPATGKLSDYIGPPRFTYQPWEFGSPWTKKTALWGDFNIPAKKYTSWADVPKNDALYVRKSSHGRKMEFRSLCSQNFAQAFKEANP